MPILQTFGNYASPNSVSIFAQPPGRSFQAFLLTNVSFPSSERIRLDLAETEDFKRNHRIARHPIERVTSQNKLKEPDSLAVTGMLCANPINQPFAILPGVTRLDKRELAKLRTLISRPIPLFIVTPERSYANMGCTGYGERYDESSGNGVNLSLMFEEFQIATPGLVDSTLDLDNLGIGTGSETDLGPQTPAAFTDPGGLG